MNISLGMLADELKRRGYAAEVKESYLHDIREVQLLSDCRSQTEDCVYLAVSSDLTDTVDRHLCFLLCGPAADSLSLPNVIRMPGEEEPASLLPLLMDILIRLMNWERRCMNLAVNGNGFEDLLLHAHTVFPSPVYLLSVYHNQIFGSSFEKTEQEHSWEQFFRTYYEPGSLPDGHTKHYISDIHSRRKPFFYQHEQKSYLLNNVYCGTIRMGTLILPLTEKQALSCYHTYLETLTAFCELQFQKAFSAEFSPDDQILRKLLLKKRLVPEELERFGGSDHTFRIAVIRPKTEGSTLFLNERALFQTILKHLFPGSHVLIMKDSLVLFRDFTEHKLEEASLSAGQLKYFLQQSQMVMGYSMPFSHIQDAPDFYAQAKAVTGSILDSEAQTKEYSEYLVNDIIRSFSDSHAPDHYVHPDIFRIGELDKTKNTQLLNTLYCYLLYDRSYAVCAEKLHIHRSTFAYRIRQLKSLITCDLLDADTRLSLLLSIRLYWYEHPETKSLE